MCVIGLTANRESPLAGVKGRGLSEQEDLNSILGVAVAMGMTMKYLGAQILVTYICEQILTCAFTHRWVTQEVAGTSIPTTLHATDL